jgi:hypothetical protein
MITGVRIGLNRIILIGFVWIIGLIKLCIIGLKVMWQIIMVDSKPLVAILGKPEANVCHSRGDDVLPKSNEGLSKKVGSLPRKDRGQSWNSRGQDWVISRKDWGKSGKDGGQDGDQSRKDRSLSQHYKWVPGIKLQTFLLTCRPGLLYST